MKGQWGKLTGYVVGTGVVAAAITLLPPLIGGGSWLPDLISTEGAAIDKLFWGLLWLSIVIFAIVCGVVVYSMVHFRAAPGDMGDGEHIHGNAKMEIAWIVIPTIIVFVIGLLSYIVLEDNEVGLYDAAAKDDKGAATMVVDVRGFSFGWAFRYETNDGKPIAGAEDAQPSSELVLPVDEIVRFNVMSCSGKEHLGRIQEETQRELAAHGHEDEFAKIEPGICEKEWDLTTPEERTDAAEQAERQFAVNQKRADGKDLNEEEQLVFDSQPRFHGDQNFIDVNHAFWVPEARLKIDAVSGLRTYVQWTPDHVTLPEDNFQVVCAELCGSGHNGMRTEMCVVHKATFDWWAKLTEDERRVASCVNLRLLACLGEKVADRSKAIDAIAEEFKEDTDAACDVVKEKI